MWWKDSERGRDFSRPAYTVKDIIINYRLQEKPLDGQTLFSLLEPLAGTSFMQTAIDELHLHTKHERFNARKGLYPSDLNQFFWGSRYPYKVIHVDDPQLIDEATIAVQSLSTHALGIDEVSVLNWMKNPSEMLLMQGRWDSIYHDQERQFKAFSHLAAQWQFYARGSYLQTIPESKIQYENEAGRMQEHVIMPDGFHDTTFFVDQRRRPFLALTASQQEFNRCFRRLYISPRFSFDAARRK